MSSCTDQVVSCSSTCLLLCVIYLFYHPQYFSCATCREHKPTRGRVVHEQRTCLAKGIIKQFLVSIKHNNILFYFVLMMICFGHLTIIGPSLQNLEERYMQCKEHLRNMRSHKTFKCIKIYCIIKPGEGGPGQLSRYSDTLRAGRSGDRIPVGTRPSTPVQTSSGAHPASYTMGTGSFPGVKRPGHGADHPPLCRTEVEGRVELYLYSPSGP